VKAEKATDLDAAELSEAYRQRGIGRPLEAGLSGALLIVDFINGFTDSAYATGFNCDGAVEETARLISTARLADRPVIFSTIVFDLARQAHSVWCRKMPALTCLVPDSPSVRVDARLGLQPRDLVVTKSAASCFTGTDLAAILWQSRTDTLFVCGATTSGCVRASVVDACMAGFATFVVRECVADRAAAPHAANLFDIQSKYGDVISASSAHEWLRGNSGPSVCK
jgi:maleamate amidohydrolase